jgi:hypothetical protein
MIWHDFFNAYPVVNGGSGEGSYGCIHIMGNQGVSYNQSFPATQ